MNSLRIQKSVTISATLRESVPAGSASVSPAKPFFPASRPRTPISKSVVSSPSLSSSLAPTSAPRPSRVARLFSYPILSALWIYRVFLSAPIQLVAGPTCGCRFHPTCSQYAVTAVEVHGPLRGLWLSILRLLKCTPLHDGGVDLVPPKCDRLPRCARRISPSPLS